MLIHYETTKTVFRNNDAKRTLHKLARRGKLSQPLEAALAVREQRKLNPPMAPVDRLDRRWIALPISDGTAAAMVAVAKTQCKKRVFHDVRPTLKREDHGKIGQRTEWEKYGRRSYPRNVNTLQIYSCAYASKSAVIAHVGDKKRTLKARKNYVFGVDEYGIYIARAGAESDADKYHPTGEELLRGNAALIKALSAIKKQRKEALAAEKERAKEAAARRKALPKARKYGITVCFRDSIRAGNCAAGTLTFGDRHGLERGRHYPLKLIEKLSERKPEVKRVIQHAIERAAKEMATGVCWLADHR